MSESTVRALPSSICCCRLWQLISTRWIWILVCYDKSHHDHTLHNCWSDIRLGWYQRSSRARRFILCLTCPLCSTQYFMEGLSNFKNGQAFIGGFSAFSSNFVYAFYSFGGVELVAIAAGESSKPYKSVPRAIKATFFRIVLFYILTILTIGLCINHADPTLLDASTSGKCLRRFIRKTRLTESMVRYGICFSRDYRFPSCRFWASNTCS